MKKKILVGVALGLVIVAIVSIVGGSGGSKNYMDSLQIKSEDVMNGSGTQVIGQYGYVKADEAKLKEVSKADFDAWVKANVEGQNQKYNWVTIDFGNGIGIQWAGCITSLGSPYGTIDETGCLTGDSKQNFEDILS